MDYQGGEMIRGFVHSFDNDKEQEITKQLEEAKQSKLENLDKSFNALQNKLDTYFKQ